MFAVVSVLCVLFAVFVIIQAVQLILIRRSLDEIQDGVRERLVDDGRYDTNTLISVSSSDRHVRELASVINDQLRHLRNERRRYQNGDNELKEAITNISHDLRTPITAISGYLDLLRREETSETVGRYLAILENRVDSLRDMAESLFEYSVSVTIDHSDLEVVLLNRAVEDAVSSYYALFIERGITPKIELPDEKVGRILNRAALSRILGNIITNAIKYSAGDLRIVLSDDGTIVFSNTSAQLDETAVGRLFDRFYTVENGRKSTGLGLSIAKTLTEQMGGRIHAEYREKILSISVTFS